MLSMRSRFTLIMEIAQGICLLDIIAPTQENIVIHQRSLIRISILFNMFVNLVITRNVYLLKITSVIGVILRHLSLLHNFSQIANQQKRNFNAVRKFIGNVNMVLTLHDVLIFHLLFVISVVVTCLIITNIFLIVCY